MSVRSSIVAVMALVFAFSAQADGTATNSQVGVVIERVVRSPEGVAVDFLTDQPPPYIAAVFPTACAAFDVPRWPVSRAYSSGQSAVVPGDFTYCPVFVCVMSEPEIPTNRYYRQVEYASVTNYFVRTNEVEMVVEDDSEEGYSVVTNLVETTNWTVTLDLGTVVCTNDFGLDAMTAEQFGYYCRRRLLKGVVDVPDWRNWKGYHADVDGRLWEWNGHRRIDVDWTAPCHHPWRSEYVLLAPPFVSMSAHGGVRLDRSDDGMLFWQADTNAVPDRIYPGGL